jgi:hypothetical protein
VATAKSRTARRTSLRNIAHFCANLETSMRKLIAIDDDTFDKLRQLARDRMATIQDLADEAFADLLKKHGIPIDLKDALRKSAREAGAKAKVIPLAKRKKPTQRGRE